MSEQIEGVEQEQAKLTAEEKCAKTRLDNAVADLQKAAHGTTLMVTLQNQLLIMQVDILIDLLAELKIFPRVEFWNRIAERVDALASDCRRAVLSQGGASALAGLKKPS